MIEAYWLNVGSLLLGLIAWTTPIITLIQFKKDTIKKALLSSVTSLVACSLSLCMQILYTGYLVKIQDWTALLDTYAMVIFASLVLIIITIAINTLALTLYLSNK